MITIKILECQGCGLLINLGGTQEKGTGHHVVPDDPEADWICHGEFVETTKIVSADVAHVMQDLAAI